jgi:TP901 family phage tail tape measure protein
LSDILDKDIRLRLLIESAQALRDIPKLGEQLKNISKSGTGELNKSLDQTVQKFDKMNVLAKQRADASKQQYKDEEDLIKRHSRLLQSELEARQRIVDMKSKQAFSSNTQYWKDEENAIKRRTDALKSWMQSEEYNNGKNPLKEIASYQSQLGQMNSQAQKHYQLWKQTGDEIHKSNFDNLVTKMQSVNRESVEFHKAIGLANRGFYDLGHNLDYFMAKTRSHMAWLLSGAVLAGLIGLPVAIENIARETEVLSLKIKQNLELVGKYANNHQALNEDIQQLNDIAGTFAIGYGANVKDVMEMMQILSRRFKSKEELTYFTNLALVMHKLDFVSPKAAAENLEAVILSMGLDFKEASRFIDEFSVAVHTARITGTDLLLALQRSGATFKNMNMNTAESIAMISTLSTVVAKTGSNIGVSLNSLLTNVDFPKAAKALEAYNIKVYELVNGTMQMRRGVDIWREIAAVFNGLDDQKANEFALAMSGGKFRINDLKAIVGSWDEFEKILTEIQTKASPELTASLLQTGLKSYNTSLQSLSASFQVLGVIIGNEAIPALKQMADGLSEGVQWLIDHREEVKNVIHYIELFAKTLAIYKAQQLLANVALRSFTFQLGTTMALSGQWGTVMATMGSAVLGFASKVGIAVARMAAFMAVAYAVTEMIDASNQAKSEKDYLSKLPQGGLQSLHEVDDVALLVAERNRLADLPGSMNTPRIAELNQQIRDKLAEKKSNDKLSKVQQMIKEAEQNIVTPGKINNYPSVDGQDIGSPKGSSSSVDPSVSAAGKIERSSLQQIKNELFLNSKLSADKYSMSLERLNAQENIYGRTTDSVINRLMTQKKRVDELTEEEGKYQVQIKELQQDLEDKVEKDVEFQDALSKNGVNWKSMSKEAKAAFRETNTEFMQNFQTLNKINDILRDLKGKLSDIRKEKDKTQHELMKESIESSSKILQDNRTKYGYLEQIEGSGIGRFDPSGNMQKQEIHLKYLQKEIADTIETLNAMEIAIRNAGGTPETDARYMQTLANLNKLRSEARDTADKFYDIRKAWADATVDMVVSGNSFKDIMKKMWQDLAKEAIYQMFRIKQAQSTLSAMAGKGKSASGISTPSLASDSGSAWGRYFPSHDGSIVASYPKMHSGGVVPYLKNDEVVRTLQVGEEVNSRSERRSLEMANEQVKVLAELVERMAQNQSNGGSQPIIINAIDSQSFVEMMDKHGEAMVNIMRKQGSLGNGGY